MMLASPHWCLRRNLNAKADGRFDKADFVYDPQKNEYRCPADQPLIWRFATVEKGMTNHRYWSSNCKACPLKEKCTPSPQRRVTRWEHQDVLEIMQARLEQTPDAMRIRRCTVEHPYGTIKAWMGSTHFLSKGLERVRTEMSLHVLAYNLKRLIAILGIADMMKAIRAFLHLRGLKVALPTLTMAFRRGSRLKPYGSVQPSLAFKLSLAAIMPHFGNRIGFLHSLGRTRPSHLLP